MNLKVPVGDVNTENVARTHRHHTRFGATGGDRIQRADGIRARGATEVPDTAPSKEQQRIGALLAKLHVGPASRSIDQSMRRSVLFRKEKKTRLPRATIVRLTF